MFLRRQSTVSGRGHSPRRGATRLDPDSPNHQEASAYRAAPDSEYGWENLFSERLYLA